MRDVTLSVKLTFQHPIDVKYEYERARKNPELEKNCRKMDMMVNRIEEKQFFKRD